jgi:hypothetical protein
MAVNSMGMLEACVQSFEETFQILIVPYIVRQQDKLITTEAAHQIIFPRAGLEALGNRDQKVIPSVMAEIVIHILEVIQIDEEQRRIHPARYDVLNRVGKLGKDERAIRRASQWIMGSLVDKFDIHDLPFEHDGHV